MCKVRLNKSIKIQLLLPLTFRLRRPGQRPHSTKHIYPYDEGVQFLKYFKTTIVYFEVVEIALTACCLKTLSTTSK